VLVVNIDPIGQFSCVCAPWIVRSGFASAFAESGNTVSDGGKKWPPADIARLETPAS